MAASDKHDATQQQRLIEYLFAACNLLEVHRPRARKVTATRAMRMVHNKRGACSSLALRDAKADVTADTTMMRSCHRPAMISSLHYSTRH